MDIWTRGRERKRTSKREREKGGERTNKCRYMKGRREDGGMGRSSGMKGTEVPEMKDARTVSPSSSTCDPFYHPATSSPPSFVSTRRFAWDKGSGHGDDSNRI